MIQLREIDESNFSAILKMKRPEGEGYVASSRTPSTGTTSRSVSCCWMKTRRSGA